MARIVVTSLADSGKGSLRAALAAAEANGPEADRIAFDPSLLGGTIYLDSDLDVASGQVFLNGDIDGDGIFDVTISGAKSTEANSQTQVGMLLNVGADADVRMSGVHMTQAVAVMPDSDFGRGDSALAGVVNRGTLKIVNSVLSELRAKGGDGYYKTGKSSSEGDDFGGSAIAGISNSGTLKIRDSHFLAAFAEGGDGGKPWGNNAEQDAWIGARGGSATAGIWNRSGDLDLRNLLFANSKAIGGDGATACLRAGNGGDATVGVDNLGAVSGSAGLLLGEVEGGRADGVPSEFCSSYDGTPGTETLFLRNAGTSTLTDKTTEFSGDKLSLASRDADTISGSNTEDDFLLGLSGNDTLSGLRGHDFLDGGPGKDVLLGGKGADQVRGGSENDLLRGGDGGDALLGGSGHDRLLGGRGADTLHGNAGRDQLKGHQGNDLLFAGDDNDILRGQEGSDQLFGGAGADKLIGGPGLDSLEGQSGRDVFVYQEIGDSRPGPTTRDVITDFHQGKDKINLKALDAIAGGGDDAFTFIGTTPFSATAGEMRVVKLAGYTLVRSDVTGDGVLDFDIALKGSYDLSASDFLL